MHTMYSENMYSENVQKQPFADVFQKGILKSFTIFTGKHLC